MLGVPGGKVIQSRFDSANAQAGGRDMLEDAVYYSRREADERALAKAARDPKIKQVHLLLADKYLELARRELATIDSSEAVSPRSISDAVSAATKRASPGIR